MTAGSGCCLERRHTGLCCWCQSSLALRCFFWDVSYHLLSLPGAHRARGDSVQLETEILPVEFSEHLLTVLPFRAVATAKVFWSFLDHWRKCFCFTPQRREEIVQSNLEEVTLAPLSNNREATRPHPVSPIRYPEMQKQGKCFQAGTQSNF